MTPTRNPHFARSRSFSVVLRALSLRHLGGLFATFTLAGCSLFGSLKSGETDTVPLPEPGSSAAYDSAEAGKLAGLGTAPLTDPAAPSFGTEPTTSPITDTGLISFRTKPTSTADAWAAPRAPIHFPTDGPPSFDPNSAGSSVDVPIPSPEDPDQESRDPLLTLDEFRRKVFAVQKDQETVRFREALGIAVGSETLPAIPEPVDSVDPLAEAVAQKAGDLIPEIDPPDEFGPGELEADPDSPAAPADSSRTEAAYQVFRWNLMETLAGAERAYWRLHFADSQYELVEKSMGTLAGINDKARIGVLRKTRTSGDIVTTETLRAQREASLPESAAMRTAAMSELASYYTPPGSDASLHQGLVRTEPPPLPATPLDAAALIDRARAAHPLYLSERMRVENPENPDSPAAKAEIDALDSRLEERVGGALERLRTAHEAIEKSRSEAEALGASLDENLRNFAGGKADLPGITAFEASLFSARQAHINALWDYQNALLDLELEVGDFLETRGQEVPLSSLLGD